MTTLAIVTAPAAMGLDLHHVNVGAIVGIAFLVLIFRAWLGK
jgi:hypothetical protein